MITIIDYGMGNLGSIQNMLKRIGFKSEIIQDINEIRNAKKIILPGVGSFDKAMNNIRKSNLEELIIYKAKVENTPFLGICLGMQLLTNGSDEGKESGLGLIDAYTHKFKFETKEYKIPHMGWNYTKVFTHSPLTKNLIDNSKYYFVHSYYVKVKDSSNSILKTKYGNIEFDSGISKGNIFGLQFHPEKSHKYGYSILENFAKL